MTFKVASAAATDQVVKDFFLACSNADIQVEEVPIVERQLGLLDSGVVWVTLTARIKGK
jgi:hypothetical protein